MRSQFENERGKIFLLHCDLNHGHLKPKASVLQMSWPPYSNVCYSDPFKKMGFPFKFKKKFHKNLSRQIYSFRCILPIETWSLFQACLVLTIGLEINFFIYNKMELAYSQATNYINFYKVPLVVHKVNSFWSWGLLNCFRQIFLF